MSKSLEIPVVLGDYENWLCQRTRLAVLCDRWVQDHIGTYPPRTEAILHIVQNSKGLVRLRGASWRYRMGDSSSEGFLHFKLSDLIMDTFRPYGLRRPLTIDIYLEAEV